jgi:radical SAM superfamily enzyme YgiQ (UPF0313 family)
MSNLGFQSVYRLLNDYDDVVCERAFLPEPSRNPPPAIKTVESRKRLLDTDIIAFSISFENDYPHILTVLENIGLPFRSDRRGAGHPLLIAGGVTSMLNPEPIAAFFDCFLIGEAEAILPRFLEVFDPGMRRHTLLKKLAREVPGAYVPSFYDVEYARNGTIKAFEPNDYTVPSGIERVYLKDLADSATCSAVLTSDTTFERTHLVEVARGCPHGCRFCAAGYVYRPPRFRPVSALAALILS